jgi:uncharacterized protein
MDATEAKQPVAVLPSEKVAFLRRPDAYHHVGQVECRETHMSWVFFAGDKVLKLKKPVRFPYLDFSTVEKRHAACVAELALNRRLASGVYERVEPITVSDGKLSIGGPGEVVDWLVVMKRLDDSGTLEHALREGRLRVHELEGLVTVLARFYRRCSRVPVPPALLLSNWRKSLSENRRVLLGGRSPLRVADVRFVDRMQTMFLAARAPLIAARARRRHIVDGHGDLRPEHIWLGPPVLIIDCLEFNRRLRTVDPLDEIAHLCLECDRLAGERYADYIEQRAMRVLQGEVSEELFAFYRCYRATLRARLAVAHLLEPNPRTPAKWPRLGHEYLDLALQDARRLQRFLG